MQGDCAMLAPAMAEVAVKHGRAGAMHRERIVDRIGFEAGQRHQRLEWGARSKLRLDRAVEQWVVRIRRQGLPVSREGASRKLLRIVSVATDHPHDLPVNP